MTEPWTVLPVLISAITGATAGGLTSILIGPTKAEREERGKRRIEARSELARALRAFRYEYRQARLQRLENQTVSTEAVFTSALRLATATSAALSVIPAFERLTLSKKITKVIGPEMLGLASLQPEPASEVTNTALHIIAEKYRRDPRMTIQKLTETDPLGSEWDTTQRRIDRLTRKYP
jgi:hypothetical protein